MTASTTAVSLASEALSGAETMVHIAAPTTIAGTNQDTRSPPHIIPASPICRVQVELLLPPKEAFMNDGMSCFS
jgi:hypothetical protein